MNFFSLPSSTDQSIKLIKLRRVWTGQVCGTIQNFKSVNLSSLAIFFGSFLNGIKSDYYFFSNITLGP